jgi:hypothetical protein
MPVVGDSLLRPLLDGCAANKHHSWHHPPPPPPRPGWPQASCKGSCRATPRARWPSGSPSTTRRAAPSRRRRRARSGSSRPAGLGGFKARCGLGGWGGLGVCVRGRGRGRGREGEGAAATSTPHLDPSRRAHVHTRWVRITQGVAPDDAAGGRRGGGLRAQAQVRPVATGVAATGGTRGGFWPGQGQGPGRGWAHGFWAVHPARIHQVWGGSDVCIAGYRGGREETSPLLEP